MLNPLTRSQGNQNTSLINSQEKVNTLQDKLVRDFFKRKQTNRSLIDVKPKLNSNSSSSISSKEFFFPVINNDIKDVHSYSQNNKDTLLYYKDNTETIYMNMKKIIDSINLISDNLNKNDSILIEESPKIDINKLFEDYNCQEKDELICNMNKEINLYKNYTNELSQLFFILNLKYNNTNGKFTKQYIESNSLFSNIKFFLDEFTNKNKDSIIKNSFTNSLILNESISSSFINGDNSINRIKEMNTFDEFLEEKFDKDEKFFVCIEKIKELYYKSNEEFFTCFIDLLKNKMNDNSFRLKNIETSVINNTEHSQENGFLITQIIEEHFNQLKEENENLNQKIIDLNKLLEKQKNENLKLKEQLDIINNTDLKEYISQLKEENITFIKKIKIVEQKKIDLINNQLLKKQEEFDELNTINLGLKEEITLLKKELEFKTYNKSEDDFIKILKLQRDKMKEELLNQIKNENRKYNQNLREFKQKILNLQEETKKSKELEQLFISRFNQLNKIFPRNI